MERWGDKVTLVDALNVVVTGNAGLFIDEDLNGAADAGSSELVAVITAVNGEVITEGKTWPSGDDDPNNPSWRLTSMATRWSSTAWAARPS